MIQGSMLRDAIVSASNTLSGVKTEVDALNVFPVPDGDTGTNMSMTIGNAARELGRLQSPTATEVADVAAAGMLRGARGNSGVILSLIFRGFSKGLKGREEADGTDLARAMTLGQESAYKAVMKPTEGTILTVAREAAAAGTELAKTNNDPIAVWETICAAAEASLERTPELLPQLKKAGVVDAGGKGLCIVLQSMMAVFNGGAIAAGETPAAAPQKKKNAVGSFEQDIQFTYCTEFIVGRDKSCDRDPLRLRAYLESIGDCVVVVDDEEIIKVHVHTNHPGKALEEAIKYGQFETVKVENMRIQLENAGWVEEEDPEAASAIPQRVDPENDYGFVSVAAGEGLESLFRNDLGCDQVVSGGQTMNPSTEDILGAIQATPAKTVFVLPNNKNIILAAEQAVPLADRKVCVLPTRTVPQGIAAMLSFDMDGSVEDNLVSMQKAADNVSTGSVTFAARDSDFEGHKIKEGQILALENSKLSFVDNDVARAVPKLAKVLSASRKAEGKEVNFVTVIFGAEVTEEQAEAVANGVREKLGENVDVSVIPGGQPVYYYLLSVE